VAPPPPPSDKRLFTAKERDSETGQDYFEARYLRASVGRFTTVDPAMTIGKNLVDPQRWNRYAYVRNNPLRYIDPDGQEPWERKDHEQMANNAAKASGLSEKDQKAIAAAAAAVDKKEFLDDAAHYMPGYEKEANERIQKKLDEAVKLEKAGKHDEAMATLGQGLHTVQDKPAHEKAGWGKHIESTFGLAKNPDNPANNPAGHKRAENGSREYINAFEDRVRK
jgi:RHS repeat-associated protein